MTNEILITKKEKVATYARISGEVVVIKMKDEHGNDLPRIDHIPLETMRLYQQIMNSLDASLNKPLSAEEKEIVLSMWNSGSCSMQCAKFVKADQETVRAFLFEQGLLDTI